MPVPRRAGIDRKRAEQARQYAAGACAEKIAIDIGRLVGIGRERARRRRRLHHHHDRDDKGERHEADPLLRCKLGEGRPRQRPRHEAHDIDALALEAERDRGQGRCDKPDQRARDFCADLLGDEDHGQHTEADAQREGIGAAEFAREHTDAIERRPAGRVQTQHAR
ncbi:hypothetical protein ACVWZW_006167 [Bradyrhizobium sp. F1.13.4]